MPELETDGVRTYYEESGSGPPLVLVHGLGASTALWSKLAPALAEEFHVVTYDLRGSGRTTATGATTLADLVDDLHRLVAGLDLDRSLVMGHSIGGSVALAHAAAHPEQVRAVVGIGAPSGLPDAGREGMRTRAETVGASGMEAVAETIATNGMAPSFREAHPSELQRFVSMLEENEPASYAALCRVVADVDIGAALERITVPVLLVAGALDAVVPPEANEANAARIQNARAVTVDDSAHLLPWEKPDELLAIALPFLREAAGAAVPR
jgi:pimeloyl-ACP methyl ester carboxylesterase